MRQNVKWYAIAFLRPTGELSILSDEHGKQEVFSMKGPASVRLRDVRKIAKSDDEAQRYKLAELYIQ